jgi:hypothetical protein
MCQGVNIMQDDALVILSEQVMREAQFEYDVSINGKGYGE